MMEVTLNGEVIDEICQQTGGRPEAAGAAH
jgi:hypothetical protein